MRYSILRYSYDITNGEAVNIGLVIFTKEKTLFYKGDLGRVKLIFEKVEISQLHLWIHYLGKSIKKEGVKLRNTEDIIPTINYPTSTYFSDEIAVALNLNALPPDFEEKYIERLIEKYLPKLKNEP